MSAGNSYSPLQIAVLVLGYRPPVGANRNTPPLGVHIEIPPAPFKLRLCISAHSFRSGKYGPLFFIKMISDTRDMGRLADVVRACLNATPEGGRMITRRWN